MGAKLERAGMSVVRGSSELGGGALPRISLDDALNPKQARPWSIHMNMDVHLSFALNVIFGSRNTVYLQSIPSLLNADLFDQQDDSTLVPGSTSFV
jgi:hypothetical protein